jgi:hypothetical protein
VPENGSPAFLQAEHGEADQDGGDADADQGDRVRPSKASRTRSRPTDFPRMLGIPSRNLSTLGNHFRA